MSMCGIQEEDCYDYTANPDGTVKPLPRMKEALTRYTIHMNRYTGARIKARLEYEFLIEWQDEKTGAPLPRVTASEGKGIPTICLVMKLFPQNRLTRRKNSTMDMVPVFATRVERKASEADLAETEQTDPQELQVSDVSVSAPSRA